MKIGQVSRRYNISTDSIYYYINYGLLVPARPGGQYVFDDKTLKDLEMILELKTMDFSLKEIHEILSLYRISGLGNTQDIEDLRKIYERKLGELKEERNTAERNIKHLEADISRLSDLLPERAVRSGVPVSMLELLRCPLCGGDFTMENVNMDLKSIYSGTLRCRCGYAARIDRGVLLTPNRNRDVYDTPDVHRKLYKDLPPSLISLFQRSYNWMLDRIGRMDLGGRVVMETYINAWFFMHTHLDYLDPAGRYIVVDKYPEMLHMYKELMEEKGCTLDILFIADSTLQLPLEPGSVDVNIDYFAANEHNFYHDSFIYDEMSGLLSDDALLLGTYFYFSRGAGSMEDLRSEYPTSSMNSFDIDYFMDNMKGRLIEWDDCGYTTSSGNNIGFSFHREGEKMLLRSYLAEKGPAGIR